MNLHNVKFPLTNVALWLSAFGQNGRPIGTHLWPIEEGTPPPFDTDTRHSWNSNYWLPRRFSWQPFRWGELFRNGYVPPLCGHRSASQRPRINDAYREGGCEACITAARRSGIIPLTYAQASAQSPTRAAVTEEGAAWQAAGRPLEWPSSQ